MTLDLSLEGSIVVARWRRRERDFREKGQHVPLSTGAWNNEVEHKLSRP